MMRLYLAGPMAGHFKENHPAFRRAEKLLQSQGYDVISPLDIKGDNFPDAFAQDIAAICRYADGVVVMPGWEKSEGAKIEVATAHRVGKPVWDLMTFLLYHDKEDQLAGRIVP